MVKIYVGGGAASPRELERSSSSLASRQGSRGAALPCLLAAALLLAACDGTGEISRTDDPAYGGSSSSSSSSYGPSNSSGNFSIDDFINFSNSGNTEALVSMFHDDSVSSGGGSTGGGEYGMDDLVMSVADLGLPAGGTVTLSISGGDADYEEEAEVSDDGMVYFQIPRQRVGSEITVSLVVKKANGRILCSGKKTMRVTEGCQFSVAMRDVPEEMVFVEGNGSIPDLYVCPHEVTQWEYERYCSYGADRPSDAYGVGPNFPVYYVSFFDAIVYCNKRSMAEGLTPCYKIGGSTNPADWGPVPTSSYSTWCDAECDSSADGYRLPTYQEWLYARKGGLANDSHYYPGSNICGDVAWDDYNGDGKAHEVMGKMPNLAGLYDMSGNVEEWCGGGSSRDYGSRAGGSWNLGYRCSFSEGTVSTHKHFRYKDCGFRVVRKAD